MKRKGWRSTTRTSGRTSRRSMMALQTETWRETRGARMRLSKTPLVRAHRGRAAYDQRDLQQNQHRRLESLRRVGDALRIAGWSSKQETSAEQARGCTFGVDSKSVLRGVPLLSTLSPLVLSVPYDMVL